MAKLKPIITLQSYGIYSTWDNESKALPQIEQFTTEVIATLDVEFGLIINIKKAKGEKLHYTIYHPNIPDDEGDIMPPFSGVVYVKDSDWHFYLGDTLWPPINNKLGNWRMTIEYNGKLIADKTFNVALPTERSAVEFWQDRGYKPLK
ncbi:DUF3859 domain-containing protein [Pseudoalteromonas sp. SG44-5]|uniref:DUF3859 domain-containing protein n=1 Tax=Pseudoalteromonas sp. SG44-5 TaxID=2760960 RepID=UPI0015FE492B|nr:DUF3859 domain-containing protein [Pseudoalteromonas sp. SG44-5]MBB1407297.1 DUF3859 domain-containing protein [Pseudoalteromonas sp. SG44-5]